MKGRAIFLVVILVCSLIVLSSDASAENVCCENTKDGESCVYTDSSFCSLEGYSSGATCDQTSYCKLGCCVDTDSGRCYKNTPKATCDDRNGLWLDGADCENSQCAKGCCVLGNECSYVTQARCKEETSNFENVTMTFNADIEGEMECLDECRSLERGACVHEDRTCEFTTRSSCSESGQEVEGSIGFFKDTLCSNPKLGTDCAPMQYTSCVDEDVYWFDSCGNQENIYDSNKERAFNEGYVLSESESCTANVNDLDCGNCDYTSGNICGTADKKAQPDFGNFVCKSTSCYDTYETETSPNSGGTKKNGESWCTYDSRNIGFGKDLVGSRHYRQLCINGEEFQEECADFREEMCIQGVMGSQPLETGEAFTIVSGGNFIEARCRPNRWDSCFACNEGVDFEGIGSEGDFDDFKVKLQEAYECCTDLASNDCYWFGSTKKDTNEGVDFPGMCIPMVPPGLQFYEGLEYDTPATEESDEGEESPVETSNVVDVDTDADAICSQANVECKVKFVSGGWTSLLGTKFLGSDGWRCVQNCHCLEEDWVLAKNNFCVAQGDCGAYYNVNGEYDTFRHTDTGETYVKGFIYDSLNPNSDNIGDSDWKKGIGLKPNELANWNKLLVAPIVPDEDWDDWGKRFSSPQGMILLGGLAASGVWGAYGADWSMKGVVKGMMGLPKEVSSWFKDGAEFGFKGVYGGILSLEEAQAAVTLAETKMVEARSAYMAAMEANPSVNPLEMIEYDNLVSAQETAELAENNLAKASNPGSSGTAGATFNTLLWIYTIYQVVDWVAAGEETLTINVECNPYEAPDGGEHCEECSEEGKVCSEYRCRSLGKTCGLVNAGTENEECVNIHPNDANSPIIYPYEDALQLGYTLERKSTGYLIKPRVKAYEPVSIGISTDEPAQCKISLEPGLDYDEMPEVYFGSSMYLYNRSMLFTLPNEMNDEEVLKLTGGDFKIYVRCKDASGNANERDYYIHFSVDDGPDMTPPIIETTSIANGAYIAAGVNTTELSLYLNEPADCKWSDEDKAYDEMENEMDCAKRGDDQTTLYRGLYRCNGRVSIDDDQENQFYFRCMDQPLKEENERNVNEESYEFKLYGTIPLVMDSIGPKGEVLTENPILEVMTSKGAENGAAKCGYSESDVATSNMNLFEVTNGTKHTHGFNLTRGEYTYYVGCLDVAGNEVRNQTTFLVTADETGPQVKYVYKDEGLGLLHLEMNEECTCEYSTEGSFAFGEGTPMTGEDTFIHEADLDESEDKYKIICEDIYGNKADFYVYVDII